MADESETIEALRTDIRQLESLVLAVNDAVFGFAGIISRTIVDAGITTRVELADAIQQRAGSVDDDDHNRLLLAFSRAVRMNFPGGSFEVVEGGKPPEVDPV